MTDSEFLLWVAEGAQGYGYQADRLKKIAKKLAESEAPRPQVVVNKEYFERVRKI